MVGGNCRSWSYPRPIPREPLDRQESSADTLHLERLGALSPVTPALWAKESPYMTVFAC